MILNPFNSQYSARRFSVLFTLACCCIWATSAWSQNEGFHPERNEIGVRILDIYTHDLPDPGVVNTSPKLDLKTGFEVFAVHVGKRHNFYRVGLGYAQFRHSHAESDASGAFGGLSESVILDQQNSLLYAVGYGYEFKTLKSAFGARFRFRAGVSLDGSWRLRDRNYSFLSHQDALGNVVREYTKIKTQFGLQELRVGAFAQVGFRIKHGLFLGMDWLIGPELRLIHSKERDYEKAILNNVVEGNSVVLTRQRALEIGWRSSLIRPTLWVSFAF